MTPPDLQAAVPLPCGLCSTADPATALCHHHARGCTDCLRVAGLRLDETLAQMRKDGQGVSSDQRLTIRRGIGL